MVAHIKTVAFVGIEARLVDVQVQVANGLPSFTIVGLPDKAVAESRERVRAALGAIGLSLPPKRITVNLAPADLPKEGSHYDLPIAMGVLAAMGAIGSDMTDGYLVLGELGLDGGLQAVPGVLPAAMRAMEEDRGLICPAACGGEAAWAGDLDIIAADSLLTLINHLKGSQLLAAPKPAVERDDAHIPDLKDVKGQESAKRALEVAAAGNHNLNMIGPPGSGKSMLAARLPGILPPMDPAEILEVSMIASVAGLLTRRWHYPAAAVPQSPIIRRPWRRSHRRRLQGPAGGSVAGPSRGVVPRRTGGISAPGPRQPASTPWKAAKRWSPRANMHVTYPARFQLISAMNPCRCGHIDDPARACSRAPQMRQ